jgi:hypothetical protein
MMFEPYRHLRRLCCSPARLPRDFATYLNELIDLYWRIGEFISRQITAAG